MKGDAKKAKEFIEMNKKMHQEVSLLHVKYPGEYKTQWETKWQLFDKSNEAWDKLSTVVQRKIVGKGAEGNVSTTMNETIARQQFHKKEIEKGVYGRDLIQPLNSDGTPNLEFVEHYGIANYDSQQKEYIRDKMGRDKNRERDWRTEKK